MRLLLAVLMAAAALAAHAQSPAAAAAGASRFHPIFAPPDGPLPVGGLRISIRPRADAPPHVGDTIEYIILVTNVADRTLGVVAIRQAVTNLAPTIRFAACVEGVCQAPPSADGATQTLENFPAGATAEIIVSAQVQSGPLVEVVVTSVGKGIGLNRASWDQKAILDTAQPANPTTDANPAQPTQPQPAQPPTNQPAADQPATNQAPANSVATNQAPTNQAGTDVATQAAAPRIDVTHSVSPGGPYRTGQRVTIGFVIQNDGDGDAQRVDIEHSILALRDVKIIPRCGDLVCPPATLRSGEQLEIDVEGVIEEGAKSFGDTITISAAGEPTEVTTAGAQVAIDVWLIIVLAGAAVVALAGGIGLAQWTHQIRRRIWLRTITVTAGFDADGPAAAGEDIPQAAPSLSVVATLEDGTAGPTGPIDMRRSA